jgi:hypothetical protein
MLDRLILIRHSRFYYPFVQVCAWLRRQLVRFAVDAGMRTDSIDELLREWIAIGMYASSWIPVASSVHPAIWRNWGF